MFVEVIEFEGFTTEQNTSQHTVSDYGTAHKLFELKVIEALQSNMDIFKVSFVNDGYVERQIKFSDRLVAREG